MQIFRLDDGVPFQQFAKTARRSDLDPGLFEIATPVGGTGAGGGVSTGTSSRVVLNLEIGTYAFVSFLDDDLENGLIERFDILAGEAAPAGTPTTLGDVILGDGSFQIPPSGLSAGVFRVYNQGSEVHEAAVFKLDGSIEDLVDQLDGTSSVGGAAGFGILAPGRTTYSQLDLEPGSYAFVCRIVDPDTGDPYYSDGMISEFEVRELSGVQAGNR